MMDNQKFLNVFQEVLAPDTNRVKAATATLRADYYSLPESLTILLQLLLSDQPSPLRQLAATQARSLVPKHWKKLPNGQKGRIREQLLQGTLQEEEKLVRHATARVITAVAKIDFENGEWLDVFDILLRAATDSNARQREVGTYLLFTSLESIGEALSSRFHELLAVFARTIQDPQSAEVRINTMLALSRLAIVLDTEEDAGSMKMLQDAVPQMVAVLKEAVDNSDEERTTQSFEVLQTLLGCDSSVLNKHFGEIVQFMMRLAAQKDQDEDARIQALSFLMQCIRYRKLKMQGLRVGEQLTMMCLEISTELGDAQADDEDVTAARSALGLLDEMATSLPPSQVVVPLLHGLGPYVNSPDPDRRQAGIMALGMVVEGAPDFIATQIQQIFPLILRLLEDSEMKVRRAALDGVIRVSEELPEELGKEHKKLIPAIVKHMEAAINSLGGPEDTKNLDMIRASCDCIDSLVEGLESEDVKQYLPELMARLGRLISHPHLKTKSAAISATGALAASAKKDFMPYYEQTMNALSEYVEVKDSPEELDLRSVTCDAMGSLAMAVGPGAFQRYVRPLMQATDEALHLDHPKLKETSFLFWAAMSKVYKEEFQPFLEGVLKALFESLEKDESELEVDLGDDAQDLAGKEITIGGKKIKISAISDDDIVAAEDIEDLDDEIAEGDDDWDDDLDVVTAVAQEKEIAVEVLGDILTHSTKAYLPYLKKTIEIVLPLSEHSYEGVQKAAISTLFRAYSAVWELQPDQIKKWEPGLPLEAEPNNEIKELGEVIMTATLTIWQDEEDRATITEINRNLAVTLKTTGPSLISNPTTLKPVIENLIAILMKTHNCQKDFGDTEDLGQLEETSEYDWLTIDTAMDVVIAVAKVLGETFGQCWKMFEKPIIKYASSSEAIERSTSVGTIAECIRYMGNEVTPSTTGLLKLLLHRMSDEDVETKSNAAYAIGILVANSTSQEIPQAYPTILSKLEPLLQTKESRAMDNAAGCVSRMILENKEQVPVPQVLPALIDILPLRNDFDENEPVYDMVVNLYSQGDSTIISLTPQILPVLAEVMAPEPSGQLKDETRAQLTKLVQFVASRHPAEVKKYDILAALV